MATPLPIDFNLYLITDRHLAPDGDLSRAIAGALQGGVRAVQLREKDLSSAELLPLARELRQLTARFNAKLLINSDLETAVAVDADGVHLPGSHPDIKATRLRLGTGKLVAVSTHSPADVLAAAEAGADFVTFGPVFATPSKLPFGSPLGLNALKRTCRKSHLPLFALGGIDHDNAAEVYASGCAGIACIRCLISAPDPRSAAQKLLQTRRL